MFSRITASKAACGTVVRIAHTAPAPKGLSRDSSELAQESLRRSEGWVSVQDSRSLGAGLVIRSTALTQTSSFRSVSSLNACHRKLRYRIAQIHYQTLHYPVRRRTVHLLRVRFWPCDAFQSGQNVFQPCCRRPPRIHRLRPRPHSGNHQHILA